MSIILDIITKARTVVFLLCVGTSPIYMGHSTAKAQGQNDCVGALQRALDSHLPITRQVVEIPLIDVLWSPSDSFGVLLSREYVSEPNPNIPYESLRFQLNSFSGPSGSLETLTRVRVDKASILERPLNVEGFENTRVLYFIIELDDYQENASGEIVPGTVVIEKLVLRLNENGQPKLRQDNFTGTIDEADIKERFPDLSPGSNEYKKIADIARSGTVLIPSPTLVNAIIDLGSPLSEAIVGNHDKEGFDLMDQNILVPNRRGSNSDTFVTAFAWRGDEQPGNSDLNREDSRLNFWEVFKGFQQYLYSTTYRFSDKRREELVNLADDAIAKSSGSQLVTNRESLYHR